MTECCTKDSDYAFRLVSPDMLPRFTLEPSILSSISRFRKQLSILDLSYSKEAISISDRIGIENIQVSFHSNVRSFLATTFDYKFRQSNRAVSIANFSKSNYLSGCLTRNIERIALNDGKDTVDLYITDFGFGIPDKPTFILDDAWALDFYRAKKALQSGTKFYVTSLQKVFGISFGALIIHKEDLRIQSDLDESEQEYLARELMLNLSKYESLAATRRDNYEYVSYLLREITKKYFDGHSHFPGAAVLKVAHRFNEEKFKKELQEHGIRGTSFFGNKGIILPCNQDLSRREIEVMCEITRHVLKNCFMTA